MKSLEEFYKSGTKEVVYEFLIECLKSEAVRKAFEKEDTSAIAEAKDVIDKAFYEMDLLFSPKAKEKEIINESR